MVRHQFNCHAVDLDGSLEEVGNLSPSFFRVEDGGLRRFVCALSDILASILCGFVCQPICLLSAIRGFDGEGPGSTINVRTDGIPRFQAFPMLLISSAVSMVPLAV